MSGRGRGDDAHSRRRARALAAAAVVALLAACTAPATDPPTTPPSPTPTAPTVAPASLRLPAAATTVLADPDPAALAVAASAALVATSPAVVVAPVGDVAAQALAAWAAVILGVPLLLADAAAATPANPAPTAAASPEPSSGATNVRPGDGDVPGSGNSSSDGDTATDGDADTSVSTLGSPPTTAPTPARPATRSAPPWAAEAARLGADVVLAVGLELEEPGVHVVQGDEPALQELLGDAEPPAGTGAAGTGSADPAAALAAVAALARDALPTTPRSELPDDADLATLALLPGHRADPVPGGLVLSDADPATLAAVATARAAGQPVVLVPGGDPRASAPLVDAIAAAADPEATVVAFGTAFGPAERLDPLVRAAATGVQLPGGGQRILPGRRVVALYGAPGYPELGVLGEQDPAAAVVRAQQQAAQYQALTTEPVVPAFEIIATIADAEAGPDGDYSRELSVADLTPWVDAAEAAGLVVVLDLQPGRTDFLTQARRYEELLARPNVGLALDPEWRLAPDQVHLRQIGSVGVDEVNRVAAWLAELTRSHRLPQKLFVLHQFAPRMVAGRERLDLTHPELALVLNVDGQGTQPGKAGTWATLRRDAPAGLWWGWKNFLDEDLPALTPEQTFQVQPVPDLVTYQ
jgi:hypothetical protein